MYVYPAVISYDKHDGVYYDEFPQPSNVNSLSLGVGQIVALVSTEVDVQDAARVKGLSTAEYVSELVQTDIDANIDKIKALRELRG